MADKVLPGVFAVRVLLADTVLPEVLLADIVLPVKECYWQIKCKQSECYWQIQSSQECNKPYSFIGRYSVTRCVTSQRVLLTYTVLPGVLPVREFY